MSGIVTNQKNNEPRQRTPRKKAAVPAFAFKSLAALRLKPRKTRQLPLDGAGGGSYNTCLGEAVPS